MRSAVLLMTATLLSACTFEETPEQARVSYVKNVESCICRTMSFEEDFPSGLNYSRMVSLCNETVHGANPSRYDAELNSEPDIDSLRCPEDVEPWLEVVGERGRE